MDEGSWTWYSTGVGGDHDIFHNRRVPPGAPSGGNHALHLVAFPNPGDGTGDERCDNMAVANSPAINFTNTMSVEMWIKPAVGSRNKMWVAIKANETSYLESPTGYQFGTHDYGNARRPNAGIRTVDDKFVNWGGEVLPDNTWTHLAMTYDANAGENNFILYVNGQISTSQTATGALYPGEGLLYVGGPGSFSENFNGEVDELRLWNRTLSRNEIQGRMHQALTGSEPGLVAYYSFDNTTRDLTGSGHDGVLMYKERFVPSSPFNPPKVYVGEGDCNEHSPCYPTIRKAIDNADSGSNILVRQGTYSESISQGSNKMLCIKGGYDAAYAVQTGNTTFIQGGWTDHHSGQRRVPEV